MNACNHTNAFVTISFDLHCPDCNQTWDCQEIFEENARLRIMVSESDTAIVNRTNECLALNSTVIKMSEQLEQALELLNRFNCSAEKVGYDKYTRMGIVMSDYESWLSENQPHSPAAPVTDESL